MYLYSPVVYYLIGIVNDVGTVPCGKLDFQLNFHLIGIESFQNLYSTQCSMKCK